MAYSLSLDDIGGDALAQNSGGYQLSLADINNIPQGTPAPQAPAPNMSPFMSGVVGFNTGVGRLAHGVLQPLVEGGALGQRVAQASKNAAAQREADYKAASAANPFTAGAAQFAGNTLPALMVPGVGEGGALLKLAKGAALGAGIGGAQYTPDDNRLLNATIGAAGGTLGSGIGQGADAALRYGAKTYAQSAIPGLISKATDKIKNYISPEQAAATLQNNFNKAAGVNTANWAQTSNLASALDDHLATQGKAFDATPFAKTIQDFTDKVSQMEPAVRAKYEQALGFANHVQDQAPQSFTGAVALRQNLNQELSKYLAKNNILAKDSQTKDLITQLKGSLQDTVNANKGNVDNDLLNQFSQSWDAANKSHAAMQDFYKAPNATGALKTMRPLKDALQSGTLDSAALGKYARPSLAGTSGTDQLNKLTGSDDAARAYVMRNVTQGRGNQDALGAYEKLSPPQRQALFGNQSEGAALNVASTAKNALGEPSPSGWGALGHHAATLGAPGFLGFLGAKTVGGQDWDTSLAAGLATAAAAKGGQAAISRFASPASVMKAANFATSQNKNAGRYLSPVLASLFARGGQS